MSEVSELFQRIEHLKAKLDAQRPLTTEEVRRLREEFMIDFTYNSNAIEGSTLTLQETALILKEGITIAEKPLREHLAAVGHQDAFYYVERLVQDKVELSERIIKEIHTLVLMEQAQNRGVYRRVPVAVLGAQNELPQPYLVPVLMEQLLAKYNMEMANKHIIERVCLFHLEFELIHPFLDGNGRTGRLILNLELMKAGYPPINIKFKDRLSYYACFTDYLDRNGDPSMFMALVAEYLEEELEKYLLILELANGSLN